jgi:hypothetical protein
MKKAVLEGRDDVALTLLEWSSTQYPNDFSSSDLFGLEWLLGHPMLPYMKSRLLNFMKAFGERLRNINSGSYPLTTSWMKAIEYVDDCRKMHMKARLLLSSPHGELILDIVSKIVQVYLHHKYN